MFNGALRLLQRGPGSSNRGQIATLVTVVITGVLVIVLLMGLLPSFSVSAAKSKLENAGYVVMTTGEYATLIKLLTNTHDDVACAFADCDATLHTLLLHNEHLIYLFPEETTRDAVFVSGRGIDVWSDWTVVTDGVHTLASRLTTNKGDATGVYLAEITLCDFTELGDVHIIELAYGVPKAVIGRVRVKPAKPAKTDLLYVPILDAVRIPLSALINENVYYRMKAETALSQCYANFRYYYD